MNLKHISEMLGNRTPKPEGKYKIFGILVPMIYIGDEIHLLFEVRSENLNTQPGEVCFPGGGMDENETPVDCAIRETCEELNIEPSNIDIYGQLDYIVTPFNLILYPFAGTIKNIHYNDINYNKSEVGSLFTVPLGFFLDTPPDTYYVSSALDVPEDFPYDKIQNGRVYNWRTGKYPILFYNYNGNVIWGMTARIIQNFIESIRSTD